MWTIFWQETGDLIRCIDISDSPCSVSVHYTICHKYITECPWHYICHWTIGANALHEMTFQHRSFKPHQCNIIGLVCLCPSGWNTARRLGDSPLWCILHGPYTHAWWTPLPLHSPCSGGKLRRHYFLVQLHITEAGESSQLLIAGGGCTWACPACAK